MKNKVIILQIITISLLIFIFDLLMVPKSDGSLLLLLLFWTGLGQGIIALLAAADLSGGKWIKNVRTYMQDYYPSLLLFPIIFLIFSRHVSIYQWTHHPPNAWFDTTFFVVRNFIFLLLPCIFAHLYIDAIKKVSKKTGLFAVLYLFSFIISQSFLAFDLIMTFEYPWINTLFGGYFFVEALYAGIAFSAALAGLLAIANAKKFKPAFGDFVIMIIGFALLWAGLFYSQYLVIWYGNIPEEVSFISKRLDIPLIKNMGIFILLSLFLIPFLTLISRKMKAMIPFVFFIVCLIFSGIIVERITFLFPVVNLNFFVILLYFVLMGFPYFYILKNQYQSILIDQPK